MILGYLVPETVFTVVVYRCCGSYQSVDGSGVFLGENVARLFFDEPEKYRLKPHAGFHEHLFWKSEKRSGEVAAATIDADNGTGKKYYLCVFYISLFADKNRTFLLNISFYIPKMNKTQNSMTSFLY